MRRWAFYLAIIGSVAALNATTSIGSDVGKLDPVQVVCVSAERGWIEVGTDTGAQGSGRTVEEAIRDMEETATAKVYLDTAEYLVVSEQALVEGLVEHLRPSCEICMGQGELELERVGEFLQVHEPGVTMIEYLAEGHALPVLMEREGRMRIVSG